MKKILFLATFLVVLVSACNDAPKKITGVVSKFEPDRKPDMFMSSGPIVTFSDGRILYLKNMPSTTLEIGSEIAVWYTGENAAFIFNDSITIVKPAPVTSKNEKEDLFPDVIGLPLSLEEFKILANFISAKGVKVNKVDCQYVHIDKSGNIHTLISIRRTNYFADPLAPVSQISVWVNSKNVCEDEIFFSYIITPEGVIWWDDADPKAIKETVNKLLAMARK